jgi:hypothetical protein
VKCKRVLGILFVMALLCSTASAATENKNLPASVDVVKYIGSLSANDSYTDTIYTSIIKDNPTWKTDLWKDKNGNKLVSVYYKAPCTIKGYGSYYINDEGKYITPLCCMKYKLVKQYQGV